MKQKKEFPKVKATFTYKDKKVSINATTKTKRLYAKLRHGKFLSVYFKVLYGMAKTSSGKKEMFYNDYEGKDAKEALKTLEAFLEPDFNYSPNTSRDL